MRCRFVLLIVLMTMTATFAASNLQGDTQTPSNSKKPAQIRAENTSIALRVRRVTYEDAYVSVPISDAILKKDGAKQSINFEAFVAKAIEMSKDKRVEWKVESSNIEAHPTQQQAPPERKRFDGISSRPGSK